MGMIESEDMYWDAPDGTRYRVGDSVPVVRAQGFVLFNEMIVFGTCDMCDWAILGPSSLVHSGSQAHVLTHMMSEMDEGFGDDFKHPDFTE